MRILIALTYYRPHYSGLTIYTERVARALAERGHRVTILTSRFSRDLPAHEIRDGVEIVRLNVWFHVSKGVIMPGMLPQAWKLIRKADLVHLHVPQLDAAPIAVLSKWLGKPVILTYHCDLKLPQGWIHMIANRISDLANTITASAADLIVTNTLDYAQHSPFLRRFLSKLIPVYPPVEIGPISEEDLVNFRIKHDIQPGQRIIGMAARLATEKGVEYLVQALPRVLERFPEARVLFVGPYQDVVGEEAYAARIMPTIRKYSKHWSFIGTVPPNEMTAFFHISEVVVLPSLNSTESYGMVQVEAITCGTPVIASDLPGVRVPVQNTGSGILVSPANAPELADAIIQILSDPHSFRGQPELLVRYSTPKFVADRYEELFELARDKQKLQHELEKLSIQR